MSIGDRDYTDPAQQYTARIAAYDQRLQQLERGHVHPSMPRGYIAGIIGPPGTVDCLAAGTNIITLTASILAWRRYLLHVFAWGQQITAVGISYFDITPVSSIDSAQGRFAQAPAALAVGAYLTGSPTYRISPSVDQTRSWTIRGVASAGALRIGAQQLTLHLVDAGGIPHYELAQERSNDE